MARTDRLSGLGQMFERTVVGRTLILDADFMAYQAAATVKKLSTAITRFQTLVETERFMVNADKVEVHITPSGSTKCRRFDYPTAKPYQANREGKVAPGLLLPLRQAIQSHEWPDHWSVMAWLDREADDGMMMQSLRHGDACVVSSGDKDLSITPAPYWLAETGQIDTIEDRFGWIKAAQTPAGVNKVVGHGTKFFWAQMLMGDTADNVKGINRFNGALCGPVGAYQALAHVQDENEAAALVLGAYASIKQDPLAEAQCLWLRRSNEDCAYRYLQELDLPANLRTWLDALHSYHQEYLAYKAQLRDEDNGYETSSSTGTKASGSAGGVNVPW